MPTPAASPELEYEGGLTDIAGIRVGHAIDLRRPTGCTVVVVEEGAVAGVDVRGSAPGTRETDLLDPVRSIHKVHAVVLSGGSAFGLDTASGVVRYLEEKGIGYQTSVALVPIVPAAILFDLAVGDPAVRPGPQTGYDACSAADSGPTPEGNVGAGAGATVGKLLGHEYAMKGGLGTASIQAGDLTVAALAAVNAVGDVVDPRTGSILAGARAKDGQGFADTASLLRSGPPTLRRGGFGENTTLVVVATNAAFDKSGMTKIAQMAHDGLARCINPVHMPFDGDTVFALSTEALTGADLGQVGALAAEVTARAIVRAVLQATGIPGYPSHSSAPEEASS